MIKIKTSNTANVQTVMNSIFIKFADLATALFSELLRTPVKVRVSTVKTIAYKQYSRAISAPSTFALINMEPLQCNAVLETDLCASYSIIGRLCGGIKETSMDMHEPTEIETSLLEGIIVRLLHKMREAWGRIADFNLTLRHIETNALFAQIARPKDKVIISRMEIEIDGDTGKINFCVPYCSVEALLDKLSGKYIIDNNSDVLAKLTGEIHNLKNNFAELKTDISSDISRQFKENKRMEDFPEDFEPDYAADFAKIVIKDIESIVKLVRFYLLGDDYKKAAVFLTALGTEASTKIFKRLREDEIESLTFGISIRDMTGQKQKNAVLKEFWDTYHNNQGACYGGIDFARVVLEKSIGEKKTIDIINRLTSALQVRPFDFVRRVDPEHLFTFIKEEHPQILALILSYLEPEKAAVILQKFPSVSQVDIIRRIEILGKTSPEVLREIERVLEKKLASLSIEDYCISGGMESSKEILKCFAPATKKQLVDALKLGTNASKA